MLVFKIKDEMKEAHTNRVDPQLKQYKDVMNQLAETIMAFGPGTTLPRIQPTLIRKEPVQKEELKNTSMPMMRDIVVQPAEPGQEQISSIWAKSRKYARFTRTAFPSLHNFLIGEDDI